MSERTQRALIHQSKPADNGHATTRFGFVPALVTALLLTGCGGTAGPVSSPPASSGAPASSAPPSKAAAQPSASAASAAPKVLAASASAAASPSGSAAASPAGSGASAAKPSAGPSGSGAPVTLPNIPAPVAVSLDPKMSAYLVLDMTTSTCQPNPACVATVPAAAAILKKARDAKVPVIYSRGRAAATVLPDLAPQGDDPTVSAGADKFIGTNLEELLKQKTAKTLVIVGTASNGAPLYTSFHANVLGFTVVIADDAIPNDGANGAVARYQLLNEPGFTNAQNKPLTENAVTLSTSNLITFK